MRIEAQPMSAGALTDVSQLACLIQLRETATAVNEKHFPSLIQYDAGAGMRDSRGRGAQKAERYQPMNGLHARSIRGEEV